MAEHDTPELEHLRGWIGREETETDIAHAGALAGLASLLDRKRPFECVPPLGHWLFCLPRVPEGQLGTDGHPARGGFLPPVALPRRMWAGSRVAFARSIEIGSRLERRSTVADIQVKERRADRLVFVTVRHEISTDGALAVTEEQDIVYRGGGQSKPSRLDECERGDHERSLTMNSVELFRFSALTFNAHRIHYDRDYARQTEGYPGLVVHGPLIATLLVHEFLTLHPAAVVKRFQFRAVRPLFEESEFALCVKPRDGGAFLWARDHLGTKLMSAELDLAGQ